jgi:hypothetical protein
MLYNQKKDQQQPKASIYRAADFLYPASIIANGHAQAGPRRTPLVKPNDRSA